MPFFFFKIHVHSFFFFEKKTAHPPVPMNDLPPEVLAHIIACLRPPDPALLRLRAVCKKWWRAVPLEQIIGVKKETAQWLLDGKVVKWDAGMNSNVVTVEQHKTPMEIDVDGHDIMMHVGSCACAMQVGECRYLIRAYSGDMEILKKEGEHYETVVSCSFPEASMFLRCCQCGPAIYFLTSDVILKLEITGSWEADVEAFKAISEKVWMQLKTPIHRLALMIEHFSTINGKDFWVLKRSGALIFVRGETMDWEIVARRVSSYFHVDDGVVYLQEGVIKIMTVKGTIFSVVVGGLTNVSKLCVCCSLSCIWAVTEEMGVVRKGAPFLLPADEAINCDGLESVTKVKARLQLCERKLQRSEAARNDLLKELNALKAQL